MDMFAVGQCLVERADEMERVVAVILPGVLAVEDDAHDVLVAAVAQIVGDVLEVLTEVGRSITGIPLLILETDHVRQSVVTEEHARLASLYRVGAEQAAPGALAIGLET